MEFHELAVLACHFETEDCISIVFDVPEDLAPKYQFIPGQYLTLEANVLGQPIRRSYSICSHPKEALKVAVKQIENGVFSNWARSTLKVGDKIRVATPQGQFTHQVDENRVGRYVAFAAGSGITPVLSIIKTVLKDEPKSQFILFYGNKATHDIIFREDLEGLKNQYLERLQVYHILSREERGSSILSGRIDPDLCDTYFKYFVPPGALDKVFLCGPYEMIVGMKRALSDRGIDRTKIKYELFFNPEADHGHETGRPAPEQDHERQIKVTVDGLTTEIKSDVDIPILDMAIEAGMDMPYSCKGGVCATCKAKIIEGEVEMTTNFALEEEEVTEGYVLTCQAHVKSDFVHVNFDVT